MTVALHHRVSGPPDAPVVLLGGSLGTTVDLWRPQVARLRRHWRVASFDLRGHGGSAVGPGPTAMVDLADDVLALADSLGAATFGYCGLSLGGAIGQVLAASQPARVSALVLCCTSARFGADAAGWLDRARRVRAQGTGWLVQASSERWFAPGFASRDPDTARRLLAMIPTITAEGYAACCDALAGFDGRALLADITAPTLVVAGAEDVATPVAAATELAAGIGGAQLAVVPDAGHLATAERPGPVTDLIAAHLERHLR